MPWTRFSLRSAQQHSTSACWSAATSATRVMRVKLMWFSRRPKAFKQRQGTPYSGLLFWNGQFWAAYALEYGLVGIGSTRRSARRKLDSMLRDCECVLDFSPGSNKLWLMFFHAKRRAFLIDLYLNMFFLALLWVCFIWVIF